MPLIKPAPVQPQPTSQKSPQYNQSSPLEAALIENNGANAQNITTSKTALSTIENKEVIIRKKRQYNAFLKMIKKGKFTTAVLASRTLGVDNHTISIWCNTPKAKEALMNTYDTYISNIERSKDWKAHAYLIDKLDNKDKDTNKTLELANMIQINITGTDKK